MMILLEFSCPFAHGSGATRRFSDDDAGGDVLLYKNIQCSSIYWLRFYEPHWFRYITKVECCGMEEIHTIERKCLSRDQWDMHAYGQDSYF